MASLTSATIELGTPAPDFRLLGVDDAYHTLADVRGSNGLLVMFICNHCPYVKAIREALVESCREMASYGIGCVAISSNDPRAFPEDAFEPMKAYAKAYHFGFPYLFDAEQTVARDYGAVCTPDFFGYDMDLKLRYHGRFDASGRQFQPGAQRELFEAMKAIAMLGNGPTVQHPSIGCSIKWRE